MNKFTLQLKDYFRLSWGTVAMVGIMDPHDYPHINQERFIVELHAKSGKRYRLQHVGEDFGATSDPFMERKYRGLQTFDNIDDFINNNKEDPFVIVGWEK